MILDLGMSLYLSYILRWESQHYKGIQRTVTTNFPSKQLLLFAFVWQCIETRDIDPMLFGCWPTVYDVLPTSKQHWVNISCLQCIVNASLNLPCIIL